MNDLQLALGNVMLCTLGVGVLLPMVAIYFGWHCGGFLEALWWVNFVAGVAATAMFIMTIAIQ